MSAASDLAIVVLTKALPPLITGVGGVVVSVWKMTHSLVQRLEKIEEDQRGLRGTFEILGKSVQELERAHEELRAKTLSRLLDRINSAERKLTEQEQEVGRINETMIAFVKEQNDQWQAMNRNLGRLEGILQGRESIHD